MKRILALLFLSVFGVTLFGCSRPIIYEEEARTHTWLLQRTEGYTQLEPTSRMILFREDDGFTVKIDTGSDMNPRLTVVNDQTYVTAVENSLLTATADQSLFAQATHSNRVYDPYKNRYTRALQVYQKDETTFRIFFWLYGSATDFYPVPRLLTEKQYNQMLEIVEAYTNEQKAVSDENGTEPINYLKDFMALYKAYYTTDIAANPNLGIFYELVGTSEYLSEYRTLFAQLEMTEQDWRASFESLGYTGDRPVFQILYCDLTVGETDLTFALRTDDVYHSQSLQASGTQLTYSFCPSLASYDFITVTQE